MKVVFAKLHCEQSDYLIANAYAPQSPSMLCINVCNRRTGAGADGAVFVQKHGAEYLAQQFNPNGELTPLCDSALRCVALFLSVNGAKAKHFTINNTIVNMLSPNLIETSINNISFEPKDILPLKPKQAIINTLCEIHGEGVRLCAIRCGIPYAVVICNNLDYINAEAKGSLFLNSRTFQSGINVAFIQIVNERCINIKAYRSGCGQVASCANAAAAAAYVAHYLHLCHSDISAVFSHGAINVKTSNNAVITATAHFVGNFEFEE